MSDRNLVITGMMGTGKSSIGRLVAQELKRKLVDTDAETEKRFGKSISQIFKSEGESAFRKAELELCKELAKERNLVIATGGGFLLSLQSLRLMDSAEIFCLNASAQTICERTQKNSKRPLLSGNSADRSTERIQDLLSERLAAYQRIFHQIHVDQREKREIAQEIIARFNNNDDLIHSSTRFFRMPCAPSYAHLVKENLLSDLGKRLKWAGLNAPRIVVISNDILKSLHGETIEKGCSTENIRCEWLIMPDGEHNKTLQTVQGLFKQMLALGVKRDDVVVAFGGGVVGDVAGFVAASYMRGLRLVQIPTTLLAMVDSSIGGKTGVDLDEGKNLVGAFKQPVMILADPLVLNTLPVEDFRSGMAEVIKHALIADPELFELLENGASLSHQELVTRACAVKIRIVEADPFEQGQRALLNLGHTFGHAIEKVSQYSIRHGYAVSLGLVMACELAHRLHLWDASLRKRVELLLTRFELPIQLKGFEANHILDAMRHDKKATAQGMQFVLPHTVGDVRLAQVTDQSAIRAAVQSAIK